MYNVYMFQLLLIMMIEKKTINKHVTSYYTSADTQINLGTDI